MLRRHGVDFDELPVHVAYELLGGIILRPEGQWRREGTEKDAGAQGMVGHISSAFYCRLCQAASRMVATP